MRLGLAFITIYLVIFILPSSAAVIKDIRISGDLRKTRDDTVLEIIRFNKGDEISSSDEETIRQRLIRSGLFVNEDTRIDLGIRGEEAYLSLFLKDRFSLIPVPLLMGGDHGFKGGLYLLNMNVGGSGDQLIMGGLFGQEFRYASVSYMSMDLAGSPWRLGGGLDYFFDDLSITSTDGDEDLYAYEIDMFRVYAVAKRKAAPWGMRLKVYGIGSEYENYEESVFSLNPKLSFSFDNSRFRRYFVEGLNATVKYGLSLYSDYFETGHTLNADFTGALLPAERFCLDLTGAVELYRGDKHQSTPLTSLILPKTVRAEEYYSLRAGVQAVLADFNWVYLVLPLSYELGYLDGISGEDEIYHGPVGGLTVNLKQVAIPAFSLYYGWNSEVHSGVLRMSLGYHY